MIKLSDYFNRAKAEGWAIGHFNFSTADQLKAIVETAAELNSPVMVATSEGEAKFFGREQAVALVKYYQSEDYPIFLNADHHKSWITAKGAIDAGYDTVLIDGSKLSFDQNVELTKKVAEYGRRKNENITIEGELGYLRGESQVQTKVEIKPEDFTSPEEARDFVEQTGVDRLAVVFGNIHGIVTEQEEKLDLNRLQQIVQAVPETYLVLHGASGLAADDIRQAIASGITNVHINTELRVAYHTALLEDLRKDPQETTPYKYLDESYEATRRLIKEKLELFGSVGKI